MNYKFYVRDVRSFEYHPKKEAEIKLSQRWLQLIQTREQLIQTRIRFCFFGYFTCRYINIMFIFGYVHNIL